MAVEGSVPTPGVIVPHLVVRDAAEGSSTRPGPGPVHRSLRGKKQSTTGRSHLHRVTHFQPVC